MMTARDRSIALGISLFSFVLCAINYWFPPGRYFDEVYYPRSAMEYLQWQPQYEWTHPPLTKLLIAFSMLLFGGVHALGDSSFSWRFMNVVVGALTVYLLYAFAKRLTGNTGFAAFAAALLTLDGFHFTQSRIATPEITVAFFCLFILYAFVRYLDALHEPRPAATAQARKAHALVAGFAIAAGAIGGYGVVGALLHQTHGAPLLVAAFVALSVYSIGYVRFVERPAALRELLVLGLVCGLGAASKWNCLFDIVLVLAFAAVYAFVNRGRLRLRFDVFASIVLSMTIAIYLASYIPFFAMQRPVAFDNGRDLTGFMDLQNQMFTYHDVTVAHYQPHPYSSKWWEWPILYQPVVYYYDDKRKPGASCCISEIISLPNPLTWWLGLLSVPFLGYLAWKRRSAPYLLLLTAYFAQWLPWISSPRMLFLYHFFPNDAIILLADTLAIQWIYDTYDAPKQREWMREAIVMFLMATAALFIFFYPVLAGDRIAYGVWHNRMWLSHWVRGPG